MYRVRSHVTVLVVTVDIDLEAVFLTRLAGLDMALESCT